jgi:hypothetical protein
MRRNSDRSVLHTYRISNVSRFDDDGADLALFETALVHKRISCLAYKMLRLTIF